MGSTLHPRQTTFHARNVFHTFPPEAFCAFNWAMRCDSVVGLGTSSMNSALLTCFLSSLRRFISAAFSSLLMPTRLGCVAFVTTCWSAGGVAVGDRLGVACLRGVTARRGITVKGFISTLWLTASHESAYSRLAQAMVSLRAVRHMSHVPGLARLRMHLDQRSASVHLSEGEKPLTPVALISVYVHKIIITPWIRRLNFRLCGPFCGMR